METLKELNYQNELAQVERGIAFLEGELAELLEREVMVTEDTENMLNAILNDAERRIEAAKRGLKLANSIKDPAERKLHKSKMMGHLNRTRALLDKVIKDFFPDKPGEGQDGGAGTRNQRDEMISREQAAQTLGIPTAKLQNYVMQNKLHVYNDNGRQAFSGSEVQALADQLANGGGAGAAGQNRQGMLGGLKSKLFGRG